MATLSACQQVDQTLPFDVDLSGGAAVTIGSNGGVVTLPPSFSLQFPAGSFSGQVTVTPLEDGVFPASAGLVVPGSSYLVSPEAGVPSLPVRVDIRVPPELLGLGDDLRLAVAVQRDDQSVATFSASYDLTSGLLSADVDELGPMAAVVNADAIPVAAGSAPALGGGSFSPPAPPPAPTGPALQSPGGVTFTASCEPGAKLCFSSGVVRVWTDDVVRNRLGDDLFLVNAEVEAELEFLNFDAQGIPQTALGYIRINGELRARINSVITADDVNELESTGLGPVPAETTVTLIGNQLIMSETTDGFNTTFEYQVDGVGTTELLTIRIDSEIEFDNNDGTTEIGLIVAHVRLRR